MEIRCVVGHEMESRGSSGVAYWCYLFGYFCQQNSKMRSIVTLLFFFQLFFAQGQQVGNWFSYLGNVNFSSKFTMHNELQYRNYDFGVLEQFMIRNGLGINLSENNNNLLQGYAYILAQPNDGTQNENLFSEHRVYQQFMTKQRFGRVYLQHRYRIEERFLPNTFDLRFRYFLSTNIALSNKELIDKTIYLSLYNELFISASQENAFDRNRIYGALGFNFNSKYKIEIGVLDQVFQNTHRTQVQLTFFSNFGRE